MSFLERKDTHREWLEKEQVLQLKDNAKSLFGLHLFIAIQGIFFTITAIASEWNLWIVSISILIGFSYLCVFVIGLFTVTSRSQIPKQHIELVVVKNRNHAHTLSLKLYNGGHRQLTFSNLVQFQEFLDLMTSISVPAEERSLYWSIPTTY